MAKEEEGPREGASSSEEESGKKDPPRSRAEARGRERENGKMIIQRNYNSLSFLTDLSLVQNYVSAIGK